MKPKKKKKLKLSINSRKLVLKPSTEAIVVNKCVNIGPTTLKKVKARRWNKSMFYSFTNRVVSVEAFNFLDWDLSFANAANSHVWVVHQ